MEETERSLHDAIMIVRRAIKNDTVVAGESNHAQISLFDLCIQRKKQILFQNIFILFYFFFFFFLLSSFNHLKTSFVG